MRPGRDQWRPNATILVRLAREVACPDRESFPALALGDLRLAASDSGAGHTIQTGPCPTDMRFLTSPKVSVEVVQAQVRICVSLSMVFTYRESDESTFFFPTRQVLRGVQNFVGVVSHK